MNAVDIARALCAQRVGRDWMARCPAHADATPSLAIREGRDGKVLLKCHAGCSQREVIGALRDRGIWTTSSNNYSRVAKAAFAEVQGDESNRTAYALQLWSECIPAKGTPVESYLRSRGLNVPRSDDLHFHPRLKHPSGSIWPAMVGLVTSGTSAVSVGIHRTFLARDGLSKAPVMPAKMMLGPCRGGAVRLGEVGDELMIGEGIETTLSVMQVTGHPAWAALSTSGLRSLDLPQAVLKVVVLADGDEAGEAAAHHAARRWAREGRSVRIARAPSGFDFNDLLIGKHLPAGVGS
jgi:hypothetical protein